MHYHSDTQVVEVRKWVKKQPASDWRHKTLRNGTKGDPIVDVFHQRVWLWDKLHIPPHRERGFQTNVNDEMDSSRTGGTASVCQAGQH